MEKPTNAIVRSKTPEQKLQEFLELGQEICKYYRVVPDPIQLSLDAAVWVKSGKTIESLRAAFVAYLSSPKCDFPPKPGKLIEIVDDMADQRVPQYQGFSAEDKRKADEAKDSPEALKFQEKLNRIIHGTEMPTQDHETRKAELKEQVGKVTA